MIIKFTCRTCESTHWVNDYSKPFPCIVQCSCGTDFTVNSQTDIVSKVNHERSLKRVAADGKIAIMNGFLFGGAPA